MEGIGMLPFLWGGGAGDADRPKLPFDFWNVTDFNQYEKHDTTRRVFTFDERPSNMPASSELKRPRPALDSFSVDEGFLNGSGV
jgi:hypothetical protein